MIKIDSMSEKEFAYFFRDLQKKILEDPIKYFIRNKKLINFEPTPAQTVALKCIFGQKLDSQIKYPIYWETVDAEGGFALTEQYLTETEIFKLTTEFDYDDIYHEKKFGKINFICGRRSGKSTLSAIIALFSAIKVNWKPFLKKTPVATIAILSHSVEFSQEILDIIRNMVDDSEVLSKLRDTKRKDTQSTFHLKVPFLVDKAGEQVIEYSRVSIKIGAASKKTTRGRAICTLLADEAAYWNLSENAAESDVDIFRAVRPALFQFGEYGTIIKLSSPAIKQGVLYDEWKKRETLKSEYIQFKAPSWVWNTILPKDEFRKEWDLDPDGFDVEFRANFVDSISNFIQPEFVDSCTLKGVSFLPPFEDHKVIYTAAIDAAFKKDKFTFAVVSHNEHRIINHVMKVWEGSKAQPVQAFEVAKYIRTVCKQFGIPEVIADQYAFQPLKEIFQQFSVSLVENTFSLPYKRKIYFALKRLIHNQNIDLLDNPLLAKEVKELQVEQTATGQIRIGHPVGGSDDAADALAVASFAALEKAGVGGISGEIISTNATLVCTDRYGRAFTAPHPEMLASYSGFETVIDSSDEWTKDENGKYIKKSDLEDEDELFGNSANFIF